MKMIQFMAVLCLLTLTYSCGDSIFSQSCPSGLISLWKMDESQEQLLPIQKETMMLREVLIW